MIAALVAAALIVIASLAIGQAILTLSGWRAWSWLAPGVGISAMLVIGAAAVRLPGRGVTAAIVLAALTVLALVYLRGRVEGTAAALRAGLPPALLAMAAVSIPFAISGRVDVLGVGLVNDDMASHLLIADYLRRPGGIEIPAFVRGGYPLGPHSLVAGLTDGTGATLIQSFAGLTLALAALTSLTALAVLGHLPAGRRTVAATLVAVSYLGASFLVSGAFKEPLEALILITYALALAQVVGLTRVGGGPQPLGLSPQGQGSAGSDWRLLLHALPLGVLVAGSVFNYSFAGLIWLAAVTALVLGARVALGPPIELTAQSRRTAIRFGALALAVVAIATVQEWGRIADFTRLDALNPDRFESDLGNLLHPISPLEALGVWPSGEYRISAVDASLPAPLFYLGALLAAIGLAVGIVWAWRTRRLALPLALLASAAIWALASLLSTPYLAAKALAIAAPIAMAVTLAGLLVPGSRWRGGLAIVLIGAAAISSFLALRQAPVAPGAHRAELADLRRPVRNDKLLFLGRDDFIAHEMRRARVFAPITNHYNVTEVARLEPPEDGREKFDFDAVRRRILDRVRFALTTSAGPASGPPPEFVEVGRTRNFVLWRRSGRVGQRKTLDEGVAAGAVLDCTTPEGRRLSRSDGVASVWPRPPVEGAVDAWEPNAEPTHERASTQTLELGAGDWEIALQYDSRRPIEVSAPGLRERLPANLDFRGPSPYLPVGTISLERRTAVPITVEVDSPNLFARVLGAPNEAHLRAVAATPVGGPELVPLAEACGRYVDWYRLDDAPASGS